MLIRKLLQAMSGSEKSCRPKQKKKCFIESVEYQRELLNMCGILSVAVVFQLRWCFVLVDNGNRHGLIQETE